MNGKTLGLLTAVTLGLLALSCTTETTVLPADQEPAGVTVTGSGSAFGEPDVAVLSLGVEAEAKTVGEARSQAAEAMDAMLDALKEGGVADEDIQTTRFSVQPRYEYVGRRQVLEGFVVDNRVTAKIRSIDDTGALIDSALEAGGDLARVDNLSFTIDDPAELEDEARQDAMEEARHKAEALAQAAGVGLGSPRTISESRTTPVTTDLRLFAAEAVEEEVETPVELGEMEVQVSVQVVYELKGD